jgi:hypothetical protein
VPQLFFFFEKMNYAGSAKLAIYLWICASSTDIAKVILVLVTKVSTLDLWMIFTIFHLAHFTLLNMFFYIESHCAAPKARLSFFFARHITCTVRPVKDNSARVRDNADA